MAGSLAHILNDNGTFRMDLIENLGDAQEALEECHQIIAVLLNDDATLKAAEKDWPMHRAFTLQNVCQLLGFPVPRMDLTSASLTITDIVTPIIQPDLHGAESVYRKEGQARCWLIWSNEHEAWWGPDHRGYTNVIEQAGRYTKAEADRICAEANYPGNSRRPGTKTNEMAVMAPEASQ